MSQLSFDELADLIKTRPEPQAVTPEQQQILAAPLSPALVTAGAGSGKTHTMMLRMLWLAANHSIPPSAMLGLTFTKKAAGELRERIVRGMRLLRRAGVVSFDEFEEAQISTYNSYASNIYSQYALLIGREPDAVLIDSANAYALMRQVLLESVEPQLAQLHDISLSALTRQTLNLAQSMRENTQGAASVTEYVSEFLDQLRTFGGEDFSGFTKELRDRNLQLERFERLPVLARVVEEYQQRKRELGYIEFSDQVAAAAEIIELDPTIAQEVRAGTEQVILDEYQDTSVGQTRLFSALFRNRAVMAVGDPKQSIYGWRGASAANMRRFPIDFSSSSLVNEYTLTTSWRNDREILRVANRLAQYLPAAERGAELKPAQNASAGEVQVHHYLTQSQETFETAAWFAGKLRTNPRATGAILVRARSSMEIFAKALKELGVPHQILGIGGLLRTPEIVMLTAILRAAADDEANNEVLRLLLGARFELGIADVYALSQLAARLTLRGPNGGRLAPDARAQIRSDLRGESTGASLIEALEWLRAASQEARHQQALGMSEEGLARAVSAAKLLHRVRAQLHLPLVDWVTTAIRLSGLDVETLANPRNVAEGANLEAFVAAVTEFTRAVPDADISVFLDWLDYSFTDDALEAYAPVPPKEGVVQLTTIHSAKGLEWDYVAVGTLADGVLPKVLGAAVLLENGALPNALRQDREDLPTLKLRGVDDAAGLKAAVQGQCKTDHDNSRNPENLSFGEQKSLQLFRENRRLLYVAATRAKHGLLLTSSRWRQGAKQPLHPSTFQLELVAGLPLEYRQGEELWALREGEQVTFRQPDAGEGDEQDMKSQAAGLGTTNPLDGETTAVLWPAPPMAENHLQQLRELGSAVQERRVSGQTASRFDALIELLLAQQREQQLAREISLPSRFGASLIHDLVDNPLAIARDYARPMPKRPYRATMLGNLFHSWVEQRYGTASGRAAQLDLGGDGNDDDFADTGALQLSDEDRARLEQFKQTFLQSRFARDGRSPNQVELPIQAPLGEFTIVNKLDAVYHNGDGSVEIVDWKTGRAPTTAAERAGRELQLMSYAHAYAKVTNTELGRIRATLFYVASNTEISVTEILSESALLGLLRDAQDRLTRTQ